MSTTDQPNQPPITPTERAEVDTATGLRLRLSPALSLFREAVLRDPHLQDDLRAAETCDAVAEIANAYFARHIRAEFSGGGDVERLQGYADEILKDALRITVEELEQHVLYQTNADGELLLGESELAMVAGNTRLAAATSCYGCTCGVSCTLAKTC